MIAYLSDRDIASMMGRTVSWLRKKRPDLEAAGFPQRCRIVGHTLKADVEAWLEQQRRVAQRVQTREKTGHHHDTIKGINNDAL